MIAEIYGKVSGSNSNLTERLEDELTGNFFGTMRYLPFNKGIKQIFMNCVFPSELSSLFDGLDIHAWDANISFWPREKEAEIDVLLTFDEILVGIEVKYKSWLSSDDEVDSREVSRQQLAREGRLLERMAGGRDKVLLLLADESSSNKIYSDTVRRQLLGNINFGYITWQKILLELKNIQTDNLFEEAIIGDLVALLTRKGFERFKAFTLDTADIDTQLIWTFDYNSRNAFGFLFDIKVTGGTNYEFGN